MSTPGPVVRKTEAESRKSRVIAGPGATSQQGGKPAAHQPKWLLPSKSGKNLPVAHPTGKPSSEGALGEVVQCSQTDTVYEAIMVPHYRMGACELHQGLRHRGAQAPGRAGQPAQLEDTDPPLKRGSDHPVLLMVSRQQCSGMWTELPTFSDLLGAPPESF